MQKPRDSIRHGAACVCVPRLSSLLLFVTQCDASLPLLRLGTSADRLWPLTYCRAPRFHPVDLRPRRHVLAIFIDWAQQATFSGSFHSQHRDYISPGFRQIHPKDGGIHTAARSHAGVHRPTAPIRTSSQPIMSPSRGENPHVSDSYSMFYEFYSSSEDPWFPTSVIQPAQSLPHSRSSAYAYNTGSRGFQEFRSPPVPSDCDTALDSGYGGSRTTYSGIESVTSVNDNDGYTEGGFLDPQTADQLIGMGSLNLASAAAPMYKAQAMASSPAANAKLHHCDVCGANVKTKSELKYVWHKQ